MVLTRALDLILDYRGVFKEQIYEHDHTDNPV